MLSEVELVAVNVFLQVAIQGLQAAICGAIIEFIKVVLIETSRDLPLYGQHYTRICIDAAYDLSSVSTCSVCDAVIILMLRAAQSSRENHSAWYTVETHNN